MMIAHQVTRLPGGLLVATAPLAHVESVSLGIWVRAGGRYESRAQQGISHFLEHLLFKGTSARSARVIARAIEGCGGYCDAFTQEESTCYHARVPFDRAWPVFNVLADMYGNARLAADDVRRERAVILEEIRMYRDQPSHRVQERLEEMLWVGHPLGRNLAGSERSIGRLDRTRLAHFRDRVHAPCNTLVTLAGRIDHGDAVARVARVFEGRPAGRRLRTPPVTDRTPQRDVLVERDDTEQANLALGFRVFGRPDPRRFALRLLSILLGESASSRLFHEIRERRGWAYSIQSELRLYEDTGALVIDAGLERGRTMSALRRIVAEIARLRTRGVSRAELRVAQDFAVGQTRIGLETTGSLMSWLGESLLGFGRVVQPDETMAGIRAVTADEVTRVARACLRPDRMSLALRLPDDPARAEAAVRRELAVLA